MNNRPDMRQIGLTLSPMVKRLVILNVAVWFIGQVIIEKLVLKTPYITAYLGLVPEMFFTKFFIWQVFTFNFLHSLNILHILMNMLILVMLGSELETRWGSRFFLMYYLISGVGAGFIYVASLWIYSMVTGDLSVWAIPVVGASGAIFGLMMAYGIIFGDRTMYFMMLFPMKAKYFIGILALVEVSTLLSEGTGSQVANLAHLGGLISGGLFLILYTKLQQRKWRFSMPNKKKPGLRLVVNNEDKEKNGPKYWN